MIVEFFINAALSFLEFLLGLLPSMDVSGINSALDFFFGILSGVLYFFPMSTVRSIFAIIVGLFVFRLFVSLIKTLWQLIPVL